jgi:transposase InsO family protein
MTLEAEIPNKDKWAQFRLSVIGSLLMAPPAKGHLKHELKLLSKKDWTHPISGVLVKFSHKTLEDWYYKARKERDNPIQVLQTKSREDSGQSRAISSQLKQAIFTLHKSNPNWSHQLHYDNLLVLIKQEPELGKAPSYHTVRRFRLKHGLRPEPFSRNHDRTGYQKSKEILDKREMRSYEMEYVGALWHLDFHHGSRKVLASDGQWYTPKLLAIMDDHSRLVCHIQWYLEETAQMLIHGLSQAIMKRGLPRALMTDNGSAMCAMETVEGLRNLSVLHKTTLPYTPQMNGKQEVLWVQVEGRLMKMLQNVENLDLKQLNNYTCTWTESEYNKKIHSETGKSPLERFIHSENVLRESPSSSVIKEAFTKREKRSLRRSDCTISLNGKRYEIPWEYRHLNHIFVRYASWDLSNVWLSCSKTGNLVCRIFPVDPASNSTGRRRMVKSPENTPEIDRTVLTLNRPAPKLEAMMQEQKETGLPPAYIPFDSTQKGDTHE